MVLPGALVDELLPVADRWSMEGPAADELAQWLRLDRADPRYVQDVLSDRALATSARLRSSVAVALACCRALVVAALWRTATSRWVM